MNRGGALFPDLGSVHEHPAWEPPVSVFGVFGEWVWDPVVLPADAQDCALSWKTTDDRRG
jgi:hypothetical protein